MGGIEGVAGSLPMNTAVHIPSHGAQINFGDLPPYLFYARSPLPVAMPLGTSVFNCSQIKVILTCMDVKRYLLPAQVTALKLAYHRSKLQT